MGTTPLMRAIGNNDMAGARKLLNKETAHQRCKLGETALMRAAEFNKAEFVELLLPLSDPNAKHGRGLHALSIALSSRGGDTAARLKTLRLLLPVTKKKPVRTQTLLMRAAWGGDVAVIQELLPISDPNAQDEDGRTALGCAVTSEKLAAAKLLAPLTNQELRDKENLTALQNAAWRAPFEFAQAIFNACAPAQKATQGPDAFERAARLWMLDEGNYTEERRQTVEMLMPWASEGDLLKLQNNCKERRWEKSPQRQALVEDMKRLLALHEARVLARVFCETRTTLAETAAAALPMATARASRRL